MGWSFKVAEFSFMHVAVLITIENLLTTTFQLICKITEVTHLACV